MRSNSPSLTRERVVLPVDVTLGVHEVESAALSSFSSANGPYAVASGRPVPRADVMTATNGPSRARSWVQLDAEGLARCRCTRVRAHILRT